MHMYHGSIWSHGLWRENSFKVKLEEVAPGFVDVRDHLMGDLRDGRLGAVVPGCKGPLIVRTAQAGTCEGKGLQARCKIAVGGGKGIGDMKDGH